MKIPTKLRNSSRWIIWSFFKIESFSFLEIFDVSPRMVVSVTDYALPFQAGKSQAKASPDNAFMQEEMPNALEPLQLSSELLDQSSRLIKKDGKSSSGRSTLIDACRS